MSEQRPGPQLDREGSIQFQPAGKRELAPADALGVIVPAVEQPVEAPKRARASISPDGILKYPTAGDQQAEPVDKVAEAREKLNNLDSPTA